MIIQNIHEHKARATILLNHKQYETDYKIAITQKYYNFWT